MCRELRAFNREFQNERAVKMLKLAGRPSTEYARRADWEEVWVLQATPSWTDRNKHLTPPQVTCHRARPSSSRQT
jgi:hypothetical protein